MPPKIPPLPPESLDAIEFAAADWLVLQDQGLTAAQELDFARWLALDPRHADVFRALAATWSMLGENRTTPTQAKPPPGSSAADLIQLRRRRFWLPASLAAAAAIALGLFAWQRFAPRDPAAPFHSLVATEIGALRQF